MWIYTYVYYTRLATKMFCGFFLLLFILNVEPRVAKKWNVANRAKPVPQKGQIKKNWIFAH